MAERGSEMSARDVRILYVLREGVTLGPYTRDEVSRNLKQKALLASDLAAFEGDAGWKPLAELFPAPSVGAQIAATLLKLGVIGFVIGVVTFAVVSGENGKRDQSDAEPAAAAISPAAEEAGLEAFALLNGMEASIPAEHRVATARVVRNVESVMKVAPWTVTKAAIMR